MSAEDIEQQAADWLAREDRGLEAAERFLLTAWLEESTLNRVAYLRLKGSWDRAERLAVLKNPLQPASRPQPAARRPLRWALAAAAALLLAAGGAAALWLRAPVGQDYVTAIGTVQSVRLADGSRMELNTDTRVRTDVSAERRTVTLESGEAYFDVVHDARHPFTVYAGSRRITDLGTKFSVYRNGDDVRVMVKEGRVRVDTVDRPAVDAPVVADAGHMVIAKGGEALVFTKPDAEIANDLSWRSGTLVFSQQTLAEAAEQFNRYNTRKILVEGSARRIRIGGSFRANNVDVFVLLLHRGFGLSVNDQGRSIVVSR